MKKHNVSNLFVRGKKVALTILLAMALGQSVNANNENANVPQNKEKAKTEKTAWVKEKLDGPLGFYLLCGGFIGGLLVLGYCGYSDVVYEINKDRNQKWLKDNQGQR